MDLIRRVPVGRSPHGERGLKYAERKSRIHMNGRSPHGERGLKFTLSPLYLVCDSRSPHGERGLKCPNRNEGYRHYRVALLMESVD